MYLVLTLCSESVLCWAAMAVLVALATVAAPLQYGTASPAPPSRFGPVHSTMLDSFIHVYD